MKSTLAWLDRCPQCGALFFFHLKPVPFRSWLWILKPSAWLKVLSAKKSLELNCRRCGLIVRQDVTRFRRLADLWGIASGVAVFLGIYIGARYSLSPYWVWFFIIAPISIALWCQGKIKCLSVSTTHQDDEATPIDCDPEDS